MPANKWNEFGNRLSVYASFPSRGIVCRSILNYLIESLSLEIIV